MHRQRAIHLFLARPAPTPLAVAVAEAVTVFVFVLLITTCGGYSRVWRLLLKLLNLFAAFRANNAVRIYCLTTMLAKFCTFLQGATIPAYLFAVLHLHAAFFTNHFSPPLPQNCCSVVEEGNKRPVAQNNATLVPDLKRF